MARRSLNHKIAAHLPGLRRLPVMKLLTLAEVVLLAREHVTKLDHNDRRRLVDLVRNSRGRPHNLTPAEQVELATLLAKTEPRLFLGLAADKLSPVGLPRRFVRGKR